MVRCYLCGTELTDENCSKEHIIINGIGGRLKSKDLLCKTCNSSLGEDADCVLAEDLKFFVEMFQVQRERNKDLKGIVMTDKDGDEIIVKDGGYDLRLRKPTVEIGTPKDGATPLHIVARDHQELQNILNGMVKRGDLKPEHAAEIVTKAQLSQERKMLSGQLVIREEAFPSIVKTIVNYMVHKKGAFANLDNIRPYIKGEANCKQILYLMVLPEFRLCPDFNSLYHTIKICGTPGHGLIGLFEMFNTYAYAVVLDKDYDGQPIDECYCFDVLNQKEIAHNPSITLTNDSVAAAHNTFQSNPKTCWAEMETRMNQAMMLKSRLDVSRDLYAIVNDVLGSLPEGTVITEDIIKKLSNEVIQKIVLPRLG